MTRHATAVALRRTMHLEEHERYGKELPFLRALRALRGSDPSAIRPPVPPLDSLLLVLLPLLALCGCATQPQVRHAGPPPSGAIDEPDLTALRDGRLAATWAVVDGEGAADIVLAVFDPTELRWGPLRRVNPSRGSAVAGRQVGPRVAADQEGTIIVSWVDRDRDPAGDIVVSTSGDEGRSFSMPRRVNDDRGLETGQEYHDMTIARDGTLIIVWLDERDAPEDSPNEKQVYMAASDDLGSSFSANRALTSSPGGVCPCCRPAVVSAPDGSVHLVYRDREDGLLWIRARSFRGVAGELSDAVTLSNGWDFPGCPVNGPAIEAGPDGRVWSLWVEDGSLFWARSDDRGVSVAARGTVRPGDAGFAGGASHLSLAWSPSSGTVATWIDGAGQVFFLPLPAAGRSPSSVPVVVPETAGTFAEAPAVASAGGEVYVCWCEHAFGAAADGRGETPRVAVLKPAEKTP